MLTAEKVLDKYFLDARCMLLEIAATLDRFDRAGEGQTGGSADLRLQKLYESLAMLADRKTTPDRAERLLTVFSDPVD